MATREQDLIRQVQEGVPGSFAQLVHQYRRPIQNTVRKIVGDSDAAADITQQAFIATFEHIDDYDPNHRYFSWLYRIAQNLALNSVRRRRHLCKFDGHEPTSPVPPPDALVQSRERCFQVHDALASLKYKYRIVLVLRHYLDFSYADIAHVTGLPLSTVRSRIHEARRLMRERLLRQDLQFED